MIFILQLLFSISSLLLSAEAKSVKLTGYWVAFEKDFPLGSDSTLATCKGEPLAKSGKEFADTIALEGSGYLRDDKTVLNLGSCISDKSPCKSNGGKYSCFDKVKQPVGSRNNPLIPYVTMASNDIKYGTTGIVREFVNKRLPSGETHDGCVRIEDTCSTCKGNHLDFFAYKKKHFYQIQKEWGLGDQVDFQAKSCKPKKYNV